MSSEAQVLLFLVGFGLVAGFFVARSSERRIAIHGGNAARLFNFVASALLISITPTVLLSIFILRLPLLNLVAIVVTMFVSALLLLMPYAAIEKPAQERLVQQDDRGWTREDAEASGL